MIAVVNIVTVTTLPNKDYAAVHDLEGKLGSAGGDLSFDLNRQIKGKTDKMRALPLILG